eukprot:6243466-Prymnesium_polylepis.1
MVLSRSLSQPSLAFPGEPSSAGCCERADSAGGAPPSAGGDVTATALCMDAPWTPPHEPGGIVRTNSMMSTGSSASVAPAQPPPPADAPHFAWEDCA